MKLVTLGLSLLAFSAAPQSSRADQMWGYCPEAVPAVPGTQGSYYAWDEFPAELNEFITHSCWHRMTLQPGETLLVRVQPTSCFSIFAVFADLYDSCPQGAGVGIALPATSSAPGPNPGRAVTNLSAVPKTYWLQVYPWASGGFGYMNYDLEVVIALTGASYCVGAPNSVGSGGTLAVLGTNSVAANNLMFCAANMPSHGFAMLANGTTRTNVSFGDGTLCIAGSLQRLYVRPVSATGTCNIVLDIPSLPPSAAIVAGHLRNFQVYYRDPLGPLGTGFNLTNAMTIPFMP